MSKPPGIRLERVDGVPVMRVCQYSRVEDAIWDAVEEAINAGWDARKFRMEAASAWEHRLKEDAKDALRDLTK